MRKTVDANGNVSTWRFNMVDHEVRTCDPDRGCRQSTYYADGRPRIVTDAKGQVTEYQYDALGRVKLKTHPQSGLRSEWFYDVDPATGKRRGSSLGRVTRIDDPAGAGSTQLRYDPRGRVEETEKCVQRTCVTWRTTYDVTGRLERVTYPDAAGLISPASEVVKYEYDPAGRIERVSEDGGGGQTYVQHAEYGADDRPTVTDYGNGTTTVYRYDADREWLDRIEHRDPGGAAIVATDVGHDLAGHVDSLDRSGAKSKSLTLTPDELGRLKQVSGSQQQELTYDALGNITRNSRVGDYHYDDPAHVHAVTSAGGASYRYDANGNLEAGAGRTFTWTEDDQLASVTSGPSTVSYTYDAQGAHVTRVAPGGATTVFAGPYVEVDPSGGHRKNYYAGPRLIARRTAAGLVWLHPDQLGSPQLLTDAQGAEVAQYAYAPFGETLATAPTADQPVGYAGHRTDPTTGLVDAGAREYDPVLGRFLSPDAIVPDPTNPQALNRYSYVYNGPYDYVDPDGHLPKKCAECECLGCHDTGSPGLRDFVWRMVLGLDRIGNRERLFRAGVLVRDKRRFRFYPNGLGAGKWFRYVGPCPNCHGQLTAPKTGDWYRELGELERKILYGGATVGSALIVGGGFYAAGAGAGAGAGAAAGAGGEATGLMAFAGMEGEMVLVGAAEGTLVITAQGVLTAGAVVGTVVLTASLDLEQYRAGKGHHIPAKSAFSGDPSYDPADAPAIPDSELDALGVDHDMISLAQQILYREFAKTGQKLTWEAAASIETKALEWTGIPRNIAEATVDRAIDILKQQGVAGPTRVPWGG
jgi:RHS repeat-associated protein